jgi:hypothetical protein
LALLERIAALPEHVFWPAGLSCGEAFAGTELIAGHRQVTDLYLTGLARANGGVLVTFARGAAAGVADRGLVEVIGADAPG